MCNHDQQPTTPNQHSTIRNQHSTIPGESRGISEGQRLWLQLLDGEDGLMYARYLARTIWLANQMDNKTPQDEEGIDCSMNMLVVLLDAI